MSSSPRCPQANATLLTVQEEVTTGYQVPVRAQLLLAMVLLPSVAGSIVRIRGEHLSIVFINVAGVLTILLLPTLYDSAVTWP